MLLFDNSVQTEVSGLRLLFPVLRLLLRSDLPLDRTGRNPELLRHRCQRGGFGPGFSLQIRHYGRVYFLHHLLQRTLPHSGPRLGDGFGLGDGRSDGDCHPSDHRRLRIGQLSHNDHLCDSVGPQRSCVLPPAGDLRKDAFGCDSGAEEEDSGPEQAENQHLFSV